MSFLTSLQNPPKEARYWMPVFYYRDPVTGSYTPYYPKEYHLDIPQSWLCPLSAGAGIMVDYRCVIYDSNREIIGIKDLNNIVVRDSEEFVYNWGAGKINAWMLIAPIAVLGVVATALARRKK